MDARIDNGRKPTPAKLRAPASRVPTDPLPSLDGVCVRLDCDEPTSRIAQLNEDPFCSTECCRAWYGVER